VFRGALLERVLPRQLRWRRTTRDALLVLALAAAVIALAEPRFDERVYSIEQKGVDIVLAIDLSRSMDAGDVDPSRLERARREILDLIELLEGDRVGMVIFAGGAYPRMPLTQDYQALELLVAELDTQTFQVQGSEVGLAIRTSLQLLGSQKGSAGQAILLLSDGEVHHIDDALAAAREAARAGVRIYALGIGVEAAPIPVGDGTWLSERTGETVLSRPSPDVLTDVARLTGGAYVQSVASAEDVERLYRAEMRGSLEAAEHGSMQRKTSESGFQWPLGFGVIAALVAAWIGEGRRGLAAMTSTGMAALLWVALGLPAQAQATGSLGDADVLYRAGRFQEAADALTELSLDAPEDASLLERLAAARYRAGDADGAARAWDQASEIKGGDVSDDFNAGNAHYQAKRLETALERYEAVLERVPDHVGALKNRDLVAQELVARRQNQPQEPPPKEQGESGDRSEGEAGEGEPGEPGEAGEQGQPGEAGQPSEGQSAESTGAEEREGAEPTPGAGEEGQGQEGGQETSSQVREAGEGSEVVDPSQVEAGSEGGEPTDPTAQTAGGSAASGDETGPVTEAQAGRLLDGVEEGRPRVVIPGDPEGGKPW
jgi:Ca-activated chloride channel family protein